MMKMPFICLFALHSDDKDALWQVDVDLMEVIFDSLVEYLQIGNAYNIFILNPRHDVNRSRYGYR